MSPNEMRDLMGGEPTWEVVQLFPPQGKWSAGEYLALSTNRLVELCDGRLEFLPMPGELHQWIVAFLYEAVKAAAAPRSLGTVLFAPLPVRLWENKFREPDIVFMLAEHADRRQPRYWSGADLVMEVVSEDDPERDWVTKRAEYAQAGIAEYWIVDPRNTTITVFTLDQATGSYAIAGSYARGERAASLLLEDLTVAVDELFSRP